MQRKHNKDIVPVAKMLRKNMTKEERQLWYEFLVPILFGFYDRKCLANTLWIFIVKHKEPSPCVFPSTVYNKPSIMPDPHPTTPADVFHNPYTFNNINIFYNSVSLSNMYVPLVTTGTTHTTSSVASAYTVRM